MLGAGGLFLGRSCTFGHGLLASIHTVGEVEVQLQCVEGKG